MKILIVGGGSGGHIYPGETIAKKILSKNNEVSFVLGKKQIDEKIASQFDERIEVKHIHAVGFNNRFSIIKPNTWIGFIKFVYLLITNTMLMITFIKKNKVDRIFATGGYVCVPVLVAGKILRKKMFFHELKLCLKRLEKLSKLFLPQLLLCLLNLL